jgi:hypothetical protein
MSSELLHHLLEMSLKRCTQGPLQWSATFGYCCIFSATRERVKSTVRRSSFQQAHLPGNKQPMSVLHDEEYYKICGFVTIRINTHNYHNSGHYPSSCLLFETQLNSIGLSVPHRKHIISPLRAHQVNAIYRFVTMVY